MQDRHKGTQDPAAVKKAPHIGDVSLLPEAQQFPQPAAGEQGFLHPALFHSGRAADDTPHPIVEEETRCQQTQVLEACPEHLGSLFSHCQFSQDCQQA